MVDMLVQKADMMHKGQIAQVEKLAAGTGQATYQVHALSEQLVKEKAYSAELE